MPVIEPRVKEGGVPTEKRKQQIKFSDPIFHFVPGTCLAPQLGRHLTLVPFLQQPGAGKRAKNMSVTVMGRPVSRCSGAGHPNPE